MFFKDKVSYSDEYYLFYLGDIHDGRIIYRDNYEEIKAIIRKQNFIQEKKKEEYNPANEQARQFIEKLKRLKKERPKTKETVNLHSIISSIAWKSHIGIHAVWDLTIYQLFDAYYRLDVVDNYDKTLAGIYAGTVDASKINMKELNWSKIIRLQS
jgi:ABC-type multidrug transport system ATPase subunit